MKMVSPSFVASSVFDFFLRGEVGTCRLPHFTLWFLIAVRWRTDRSGNEPSVTLTAAVCEINLS